MITTDDLADYRISSETLEAKTALLSRLGEMLLSQGSVRGVTALKTPEAIKTELLLDSLAGFPSLPKTPKAEVIDIGTGGGVPGLVLAIVRPDLDFTLTDSVGKKTTWVQECVDSLGLNNVRVVTSRLELLGRNPDFRESFDAVTAKGLASLSVLLEFALPLLRVGGKLIAYKGPALDQELNDARPAMRLLHGKLIRKRAYDLEGKAYRIAEIEKLKLTGARYPRRDGVPQKTPL